MTDQRKTTPLSKEDFYAEQVRFFSQARVDGQAAQRLLGKAQMVVLGAGLIGSHALASLADAGVGAIQVLDAVKITERDLPGNALLNNEDIGRTRAEALSLHIGRRNPHIRCESVSADTSSGEKLKSVIKGMSCVLVCLDSPAPVVLDAINQAALETNVRWIAGQVYRGIGLIGPTITPRQGPCYKCYELRRDVNLVNYEETMHYESRLRQLPATRSECIAPRPLAACIGELLALEAMRIITGLAFPQTAGRVLRLDFFAPEMTYHRILRLPNCPACGYGPQRTLPQVPQLPPGR